MPKPMEHNSINQDSHLNQGCLSKYKNLGGKSVKVKMPKKKIISTYATETLIL